MDASVSMVRPRMFISAVIVCLIIGIPNCSSVAFLSSSPSHSFSAPISLSTSSSQVAEKEGTKALVSRERYLPSSSLPLASLSSFQSSLHQPLLSSLSSPLSSSSLPSSSSYILPIIGVTRSTLSYGMEDNFDEVGENLNKKISRNLKYPVIKSHFGPSSWPSTIFPTISERDANDGYSIDNDDSSDNDHYEMTVPSYSASELVSRTLEPLIDFSESNMAIFNNLDRGNIRRPKYYRRPGGNLVHPTTYSHPSTAISSYANVKPTKLSEEHMLMDNNYGNADINKSEEILSEADTLVDNKPRVARKRALSLFSHWVPRSENFGSEIISAVSRGQGRPLGQPLRWGR